MSRKLRSKVKVVSLLATPEHAEFIKLAESKGSLGLALRNRLDEEAATARFAGVSLTARDLRRVKRILMTACGTSWHAGLVGEYLLEELAHIPTEVEYASEFRYRNPPLEHNTLVLAITQSGETADTLAALRHARTVGYQATLGICNVANSTLANEADLLFLTQAGPEIGVASTKAFTTQLTAVNLLAILLAKYAGHLSPTREREAVRSLHYAVSAVESVIEKGEVFESLAARLMSNPHTLFIGAAGLDDDGLAMPDPSGDFDAVWAITAGSIRALEPEEIAGGGKRRRPHTKHQKPKTINLSNWEVSPAEAYVRGESPRYASLNGPCSLNACGAPTGYGWYRIALAAGVGLYVWRSGAS